MKKLILTVFIMCVGIINVYALSSVPKLEVVSESMNTVTLRVNVDNIKDGDVCYIYRSLDDINYDKTMMVDCNKMYTDKGLERGFTYYYKASVGRKLEYSEIVVVTLEEEPIVSFENLGRNVLSKSNIAIVFCMVMGFLVCIFIGFTYFFRKKLS